MKVSETTQKIYDGVSNILNTNGLSLTKAQMYAVESMIETVEETTEERCCKLTESILRKNKVLMDEMMKKNQGKCSEGGSVMTEETMKKKVNEMVEARVEQLKKEVPQVVDYAKLKSLERCVESIKECVGYRSDEQVEKVAAESAKMLHSTKSFIETQTRQISEKTASLNESKKVIGDLQNQLKQMQQELDAKEKQVVESTKRNTELVQINQNLQKKVEESKKINETLEEKRKSESLKYYLEQKIATYPKYEAGLLRKHFQGAKSRAEIDENFQKALAMVQEKRDAMRTVQAIPVAKAINEVSKPQTKNGISGGETIVKENGSLPTPEQIRELEDSFVEVDFDNDKISQEQMLLWMSKL